jgi:hypothetical protein
LEHLKNVNYILTIKRSPQQETEYYQAKVKFPFVDLGERKGPWFNVHIGEKNFVDSMSPSEREKHVQNRIRTYFMKNYPLN